MYYQKKKKVFPACPNIGFSIQRLPHGSKKFKELNENMLKELKEILVLKSEQAGNLNEEMKSIKRTK